VAIPFLANVTVASITTRIPGLPTEVRLDRAQGLDGDSVVNCHNLFTVPKDSDRAYVRRAWPRAEA
jgi:mRNA-degrading endonuclease toxin of MazEF toxin-antitoxin module